MIGTMRRKESEGRRYREKDVLFRSLYGCEAEGYVDVLE